MHKPWLAIDTATDQLGLALVWQAGDVVRFGEMVGRTLAERLQPELRVLLHNSGIGPGGLAGIAVNTGPGSFTSLRMGLAAARALGFAWGLPQVGIDHFNALEATIQPPEGATVAFMCPAAGRDVYFKWGTNQPQCLPFEEALQLLPEGAHIAGNLPADMLLELPETLHALPTRYIDPAALARLGAAKFAAQGAEMPTPCYLRPLHYKKQGEGNHPARGMA